MKGGPSIEILIDFALSDNPLNSKKAANILKTQVYLYEADMDKLELAYNQGNKVAEDILISYSNAEFFTQLPELEEEIKVVTYVAGIGDISTDFLSPGGDAHSRSDRELHGQSMFEHNINLQNELLALKEQHPDKIVMLIADKGTMGVGSSRMSGVNNVALWTGKQASPYIPFVNIAPIVAGTNGISPIFLTTVGVTGGIGLDNRHTFDLTKELVDDIVLVSEKEIAQGIHHAYWNESQIVEGAGAVTIASLLHKRFKTTGSSIALMCGRNINIDKHFSLISAKY